MSQAKRKHHAVLRGFTLLELIVVVVLIAVMVAVLVPSLQTVGTANTRKNVTRVAGLISEVYDRAALSGKTQRIIFDMDAKTFWVEEKGGELGEIVPELGYETPVVKKEEDKEEKEKRRFEPVFKKVEGELGEDTKLENGGVFCGIWTEDMPEVKREGSVALYFFPGGYTQKSFVCVSKEDDPESAISVTVSPLTGELSINVGEPALEDLREELMNEAR